MALSCIVAETLCVKHLAKYILVENALIPIFQFEGAKLGLESKLKLRTYNRSLGTSLDLLTAIISPRTTVFGSSH